MSEHKPRQIEASKGDILKKPLWRKIKEEFFAGTLSSVGDYLWRQVAKPALLKLLDDAGANALHMSIYGAPKNKTLVSVDSQTHVSQSSLYAGRASNTSTTSRKNYKDIMANSPACTEELIQKIIDEIQDVMKDGKVLSVWSLNDILPTAMKFPSFTMSHIDTEWGWDSLNLAECVQPRDGGYILRLPPAKPLNR